MIVSPWAARFGRARGAVRVATLGMVLITAGMLSLALVVDPSAGVLSLAPALVAIGVGIGMVLPNIVGMALSAVPEQDVGKASGVLNTARQIGAVVGVAVGVAVFEGAGGAGVSQTTDGIRTTLIVSAASAAVGALMTSLSRRRTTAETAVPVTVNA
jgi:MFS family permease